MKEGVCYYSQNGTRFIFSCLESLHLFQFDSSFPAFILVFFSSFKISDLLNLKGTDSKRTGIGISTLSSFSVATSIEAVMIGLGGHSLEGILRYAESSVQY